MSKNIKVVLLIILIFLTFIIITKSEIFELLRYYTMTETEKISEDIEVEIKSGKIIFDRDRHGGFHGDGERYTCLEIKDDDFKEKLEKANWHKLPLHSNLAEKFPKDIKINGETELKDWREDVEEGYYFYKNRFKNNSDLEERIVPNYTIAVYDEKNKMLYYYQYDS